MGDTQWAFWDGIRAYESKNRDYLQGQIGNPDGESKPNKKYYDPRTPRCSYKLCDTDEYGSGGPSARREEGKGKGRRLRFAGSTSMAPKAVDAWRRVFGGCRSRGSGLVREGRGLFPCASGDGTWIPRAVARAENR